MKIGNIELVGSEIFFVKGIDVPTGMSSADIEAFVDTTLEEVCPLPSDKIRRGWFAKDGCAIAFSAPRDNVDGIISRDTKGELPDYAVPKVSLLIFAPLPDGIFYFAEEKAICAIVSKNGKWAEVRIERIEDGNFKGALETLAKGLGDNGKVSAYKLKSFDGKKFSTGVLAKTDDNGITQNQDSNDDIEFSFPVKKLATLDLRDRRELKKMNADVRRDKIEKYALIAAPFAFAILIIWQIFTAIYSASIVRESERISGLESTSKEIEKQSEQVAEMLSFEGDKLHPLTTIAYLNNLRPDGIAFSKVTINGLHEVEIQGKSQSIRLLDSYVRALKEDKNIDKVSVESRSARSEAQFTIKLYVIKTI